MFLFGMSFMGDSLKKVAGSKMEMILYKLSGNTPKAVLLGTGVTAVIQSSSATSVMVVGFVNSGMMKVKQAIGVVLGAILGTSITGWVLCLNSLEGGSGIAALFSTMVLTGIVALIGIILWMFASKNTYKNVGGIMLGFAVLMYGMSMMSGAVAPLRENETFLDMLTGFSNPVLGILVGLSITAAIQSASAAVGILQALAMTGAVTFGVAFPIIMGIGIGASVPVMLSALGATTNGKRTAFVYLVIDVLGAVICTVLFYGAKAIFSFDHMIMGVTMTMVTIALLNTLYRLFVLLVLAPCIGLLEKMVCRLFKDSEEAVAEQADMDRLENIFLDHPALSIEQSRMVINNMARKTLKSVNTAVSVRQNFDKERLKKVFDLESVIDRYEDKLGAYLVKVTSRELTQEQTKEVGKFLRVLSDFERISDHARNIGESVEELQEKKIVFSKAGEKELRYMESKILEITDLTVRAFMENDIKLAMQVEPLEEEIDFLCDETKSHHIDRVGSKECTRDKGFVFNDLITDLERISDHCSNVAIDVIEANSAEDIYAHEFNKQLKEQAQAEAEEAEEK